MKAANLAAKLALVERHRDPRVVAEFGGGDTVALRAGEPFVVPAGGVHRPRAEAEAKHLLIEPTGTPNTALAKPAI